MVRNVVLGDQVIQTWYASIYPDENALDDNKALETDLLFVCPHCMKYTTEGTKAFAHMVSLPFFGVSPKKEYDTRQLRVYAASRRVCTWKYPASSFHYFVKSPPFSGTRNTSRSI